ncbi:Sodium/glutamate symport carrier protein [Pseudovibrio sp. W64]|uniref:sodium/glutamate symporter n=1 Tax=unclassified Pseudovibrio TaxID=2627060 RepID=UPI0007B1C9D0|nr:MULTISPECIES: sodium/glutamate symporter [unclassified Pseudovibrio]KZK77927.1 Sodium/glutamate symport carrier protein [Pseudovibrio sp. W64]KZK95805.1 Sodium/glutamate symport carrier protein [Pseudovibrio sp. Ad46]
MLIEPRLVNSEARMEGAQPELIEIDPFTTITIAILVLFVGRELVRKSVALRKLTIPDPLAGGLLCAILVTVLTVWWGVKLKFSTEPIDFFLIYFFAAIGLRAKVSDLLTGGKPLIILIIISSVFLGVQNFVGMGAASVYGYPVHTGIIAGSVSLSGGVGTTLAWAPIFASELGVANAQEIGIACNTVGIVSACIIGGPIAQYLMKRHKLAGSLSTDEAVGQNFKDDGKLNLHYYDVLGAVFFINMAIFIGYMMYLGLQEAGVVIPVFVPILVAGIIINNVGRLLFRNYDNVGREKGMAMISDISLGIFLSIALMTMDLLVVWQFMGFVALVMSLQIALAISYALFIVFTSMGKDYDAAVIAAGFGGIALGSTATAVLNMTSVTRQFGASPKAFLIVPLTCGFFIDLMNTWVISNLIAL